MLNEPSGGLSIGAVTNLTGISPETLRTWERRHALVEPTRDASGRRVYTDADVARLRLISALVTKGERVSELAKLDAQALAERAQLHGHAARAGDVRVLVVHPTLQLSLAGSVLDIGADLRVLAVHRDPRDIPLPDEPVDVLVVDLSTLGDAAPCALDTLLRHVEPQCTVLLYRFLSGGLRRRLSLPGVRFVRAPAPPEELRRIVADHALAHRRDPDALAAPTADAPRFRPDQLEQLLNIPSGMPCECPNHLASIVMELRAFEAYSRSCLITSTDDAAFHRQLAEGTARAAVWMEDLLVRTIIHDGIDL